MIPKFVRVNRTKLFAVCPYPSADLTTGDEEWGVESNLVQINRSEAVLKGSTKVLKSAFSSESNFDATGAILSSTSAQKSYMTTCRPSIKGGLLFHSRVSGAF